MKRKRERSKLANGIDRVKTNDAIVETTSTSSLTVSKQNTSDGRTTNSDPFPTDLLMDIFKQFPVKTLARLTCVSKLWASTTRRQEFKKLWSSNQQRSSNLIFAFKRDKGYGQDCFFFSSPQTKNHGQSTATYLTTYPGDLSATPSVHGLICYGPPSNITVYNPTTRRSITLPKIASQRTCLYHYLGYDPIDSVYKMLCMTKGKRELAQELQVLRLGDDCSWRMVEDCPPHYSPESLHICIDGVLYYGACFGTGTSTTSVIGKDRGVMSFDVRSEKFDVVRVPQGRARKFTSMTRYRGKLALMYTVYGKIGLWVLEDAAKHRWSSIFFDLPRLSGYNTKFQVFCAIDDDDDDDDVEEFVLAPRELHESPFYVLYYDPKKKGVRKVDIEGITEHEELPLWDKDWKRRTMSIFPGQVENLMFL